MGQVFIPLGAITLAMDQWTSFCDLNSQPFHTSNSRGRTEGEKGSQFHLSRRKNTTTAVSSLRYSQASVGRSGVHPESCLSMLLLRQKDELGREELLRKAALLKESGCRGMPSGMASDGTDVHRFLSLHRLYNRRSSSCLFA